ncbi:MAG: DUF134 domain-containing protein [Bacillota bacterium]
MPRPRKCRKVCKLPENGGFTPLKQCEIEPIVLKIDEYETLRLIDRENFSQEQCGVYMNIARTTVQQIYNSARRKIADALVEGRHITIAGGEYNLCDGHENACGCGGCSFHNQKRKENNTGESNMKIAIPLDENKIDVCPVLARAPYFLLWENSKTEIVENPASAAQGGAGVQVAQFILDSKVTTLITPRCGQNAADVFKACEMKIYKSTGKTAEENISDFLEGKLEELTTFHGGFHGIR